MSGGRRCGGGAWGRGDPATAQPPRRARPPAQPQAPIEARAPIGALRQPAGPPLSWPLWLCHRRRVCCEASPPRAAAPNRPAPRLPCRAYKLAGGRFSYNQAELRLGWTGGADVGVAQAVPAGDAVTFAEDVQARAAASLGLGLARPQGL